MDEEYREMHGLLLTELPEEILLMEAQMFCALSDKLTPEHPNWPQFCTLLPVQINPVQKGFLEIVKELQTMEHIKIGCYDKLKACFWNMQNLKKIVEIWENRIRSKWKEHRANFGDHRGQTCRTAQTTSSEEEQKGNIAVNVLKRKVCVQEGQTIILHCTVKPPASSIIWLKGSPEPVEEIFIDSWKYIIGPPLYPHLVISNTDKSSDQSYYCLIATENDKRTTKKSESIYLRVDKIMQDRSPVSSTQNTTDRNASAHFRKSEATTDIESESDEPQTRRPRTDNDANVTFPIENDIDTSRQESKEDIRKSLEEDIQQPSRINCLEFVEQCIIVSFDIKGASSPTEPSALCLAERIKSFLRTGEIRLSDDANTILKIKTDDIRLTVKNRNLEGCPIVSISQAEYHADEGTVIVMHCSVLSCPPATSVRWVRIRYGEEEELDIDNDKYLGGNVLSPSLVVTEVSYTDEGYYKCYVKSSDGEGESNTAWLETNSDHTDLSTFLHHNGYDKVDSSALTLIKTYLASNRTSGDDVPLLRIAIDNDSIDLLRYIISTEPEVLSSFNVDGCDALHYCCQYGTLPLFKLLIESGMKAEGTTSNGSTCLMMATLNRSRQILQYVIENFPKQLHIVNSDGTNCLLMSCVRDNIHIFELLLKTGISLEHRDKSGNTCLMTAIKYSNNCLARYIVENYTKQLDDADGLNALMLCCRKGNIDMTKHIIKSHPRYLHHRDRNGSNLLHHCCEFGNVELFQHLVEIGLKPETSTNERSTCLMIAVQNKRFDLIRHIAENYPEQLEEEDMRGWNVLFYCCEAGDEMIFRYLVEKGAKHDTCSFDGSTCLMIAIKNKRFNIVRHIGDNYPEQLINKDQRGWNAILCCCEVGEVGLFQYLVEKGVGPDTCSPGGSTCLMIAVRNKHFNLIRYIVNNYRNQLGEEDKRGWNALLYCCEIGEVEIFGYLVEEGANPDVCSPDGYTCLMIAALNNHFDLIKSISDRYPKQLYNRNILGLDALLCCCKAGDVKIFDYLVRKGVEPHTCSTEGSTCLMIAAANHHSDLVKHIAVSHPELLEKQDKNGWNALLYCCQAGDVSAFDFLVEKGLKPDSSSDKGLMIAVLNEHFEQCRHILDRYTKPKHRYRDWRDILLCCCQTGNVKIFDYLIENAVQPATHSGNGSTYLMIAVLSKKFDLTQHIVENYPDQLHKLNQNGWNALLCCCQVGDFRIFDYLVQKGLKLDTRSKEGSTCLMIAVLNKHFNLVKRIVKRYPEQLEQEDMRGWNALLYCCEAGEVDIFEYLVEKQITPATRSKDGLTCMMIAVLNKHYDLARHIGANYPEQLLLQDNQGWDVLLYCYKTGDIRIFDYLDEKGVNSHIYSTDESTCLRMAEQNQQFDLIRHIKKKYPERLERRNMSDRDLPLRFCKAGVVRIFDILAGKE